VSTSVINDARRWMGFHSIGTYQLLMDVHASVEDCVGAARDGRGGVAAYSARSVVLRCLGLRSLAAGGDVPDYDDPLTDPFAGLDEEAVGEGLRLIARCAAARTREELEEAAGEVVTYAREFERLLGFEEPPPSIRRPEGLYPALRLAREVLPLNEASGYPLALPSDWMPRNDTGRDDREGGRTPASGKEER
jgi:hypothetical protein